MGNDKYYAQPSEKYGYHLYKGANYVSHCLDIEEVKNLIKHLESPEIVLNTKGEIINETNPTNQ